MNVSAWLKKAGILHQICVQQQSIKNGSGRLSTSEAKSLNELQHAIGSDHGVSQVTYNEARQSLDEMFVLVKAGLKTPPLTKD